jgi:hypothetical protein
MKLKIRIKIKYSSFNGVVKEINFLYQLCHLNRIFIASKNNWKRNNLIVVTNGNNFRQLM